ncbi:hypothetical protein ON010_g13954 [Phytophthora cinnamomi]|nr:hypothetical protein ON010_g13954 [Phytophthora cinnamomi]
MRSFVTLSVVVALFASSEALSQGAISSQVKIAKLASTDVLSSIDAAQANGKSKRFLRVSKTTDADDEEERTWARINDNDLTKEEAMVYLGDYLAQKRSVDYVAKQMKLFGLSEKDMMSHINWDALLEYQRMNFHAKTGYHLPQRV